MSGMKYKIGFAHAIRRWDEGLALGNGQTGCLIWGGPDELRFSLDRTDIWDTSVPYGTEDKEFSYENLVRLAKRRDTGKIREIFDAAYERPTPTKLPAGKIILRFPGYGDAASRLELGGAEAILALKVDGGGTQADTKREIEVRSVVHAAREIGMILVELPSEQFIVELQAPAFGRAGVFTGSGERAADIMETNGDGSVARVENREVSEEQLSKGTLRDIIYEAPEWKRTLLTDGSYLKYFRQKTNSETAYGVVMGVKARERRTELFYRVVTTADGGEVFEKAAADMIECMDAGYETLLASHRAWWESFWAMSSVELPDKGMEKNWYMANYLLASCSRKGYAPMPLQGVWTADEDRLPPWKGDYHNDLNTQMSYYSYLKANHVEQGVCFVNFLWDRRAAAAEFAERFYGTEGICLPAVMTIEGKPLGGWPMYSLSPTNQIWLCRAFDDYYRYTGDEQFLRERLYPYFQGTAECIGGLLEEGRDGCLYLPISSSPEIHDDEAQAFLTPNSNYDLALLHYLYRTLEKYAEKLSGKRTDLENKWREMRRKLPPLAVDGRGVLKVSADETLQESHRHFSHALAIHPLRLVPYDSEENRRIIDAVIADLEELGSSRWVGFSFCWMAELYAIAHRGEQAGRMLRAFWTYFCSPNGFHLNGDYQEKGYSDFHYRPFTLEANMCAADALQEMLLYTEDGVIEPFPAVPGEWLEKRTAFDRLRGEGGILVSALAERGRLLKFVLYAPKECSRMVRGWNEKGEPDRDAVRKIKLKKGNNVVIGNNS